MGRIFIINVVKMNSEGLAFAVLAASLGAFAAWLLMRIVVFWIIRKRLNSYLITILNIYLKQTLLNDKWLLTFINNISLKSRVSRAPKYTKENFLRLQNISVEHLFYLPARLQSRITRFSSHIKEFESLMEGFCSATRKFQKSNAGLTRKNLKYLQKKAERIHQLVELFPKSIKRISDLSENYDAKMPACDLVE